MRALSFCALAIVTILAAGPAQAVVAFIDDFRIVKNGNLFFDDPFTDGVQPPSAPNFPNGTTATYFVNGTLQPNSESSGKLRLNSADGVPVTSSNGAINRSLAVILQSNVDPNNLVNGLKSNHTFSMVGIFDLVQNPGPLYSGYGISFNDAAPGLDRRNEMLVQVSFSQNLGINVIRLVYQDFDNGTSTTVAYIPLAAPAGADQIELSLTRGNLNTFDLVAAYAYLDGGVQVGGGTLGTTSIFQDRNWVRGLFFASFTEVPEPGTLGLLGLGLAGLAGLRRRVL